MTKRIVRLLVSIAHTVALGALSAALTIGAVASTANAQIESCRAVCIDYDKLDLLGIDRTNIDLAISALVR